MHPGRELRKFPNNNKNLFAIMKLNAEEYRNLLAIVDLLYDASSVDVMLPSLFGGLEKAVAITGAVFFPIPGGSLPFHAHGGRRYQSMLRRIKVYLTARRPASATVHEHLPNTVIRDNDLTARMTTDGLSVPPNLLFPEPKVRALAAALGARGRMFGVLGLYRSSNRRDFNERDVEFVNALLPYVSRALFTFEQLRGQSSDGGPEQSVDRTVRARLALLGLTTRQQQIALAVLQGLSNKAIAMKLGLTEQTVKDHLNAVFGRLGVHSRAQLAARVMRFSFD
jgi:DNA-binding CsgD family transcriptional regulator